jgi:hypothetical protein
MKPVTNDRDTLDALIMRRQGLQIVEVLAFLLSQRKITPI